MSYRTDLIDKLREEVERQRRALEGTADAADLMRAAIIEIQVLGSDNDVMRERFKAAREAWDVLSRVQYGEYEAKRLEAHQKLLDAISGVKFSKPNATDMAWASEEIFHSPQKESSL